MAPRTTLLLVLGATLLSLAAFACNGKIDSEETTGSTTSHSTAGKADRDQAPSTSTSGSPAPAPACTYAFGSSTSGGDGAGSFSCESTDNYTCSTGDQTLTCSCGSKDGDWAPGTCACNGLTFAFDCATGCSPGPAEYAKCNLPAPPASTGGGGSTSSSGG